MELVKYIFSRIFALVILITLSNYVYKITFWKDDVSKHSDILENLWVLDSNVEAIYFGESSNFHVTENDTTKHRISYMLDEMIPEINIGTVDNAGLHAGTYLSVIKNIAKNSSVKLLIITVNLRSFAANWRYSVGENYLAKTELMLSKYPSIVNKFLVSLKAYDLKTEEERNLELKNAWDTELLDIPNFKYQTTSSWDSAMASYEWMDENPNLTEEKIPLACHYIKNFGFRINPETNIRISNLDEIMEIANMKNYKVMFHILSENINEAQLLVGDDLVNLMQSNKEILIKRYTKKGAIVVDNLNVVPDSCFVDRNWPTEHYSKFGKQIIANNLKKAIYKYHLEKTIKF